MKRARAERERKEKFFISVGNKEIDELIEREVDSNICFRACVCVCESVVESERKRDNVSLYDARLDELRARREWKVERLFFKDIHK